MSLPKLVANSWLLLLSLLLPLSALAQDVPTPAPPQSRPIILQGGIIHTGTGKVIQGDILIIGGKISDVGDIRTRVTDATTLDCTGKHLYPGLIAPTSQIGLDEIESVRGTDDRNEVGLVNPNVRTIIGYNTDSRVTPTLRSNGILLAQIAPGGQGFAGTSSVVQLDAWNWEDAAYLVDDALHLYWPHMVAYNASWMPPLEKQKKNIEKRLAQLDNTMQQAKAYLKTKNAGLLKKTDLRWEALIPVLNREKSLFIHANSERQINAALAFMLRHEIKMVLVGGADAWLLTGPLLANGVPVVLAKSHSLPTSEDDDIDMPYKRAGLLKKAGLLVCLSMRDFWNQRNLPFQAGTAAAYGLSKAEALQLVTLNTARILGIADRTGSIEPGKDANILVCKGDLLDMRTSLVEHAFIQGRKIDLGNKQKDLYKKYRGR
ncbi:MAG TPA: amidohydrolase [Bacteroidetes bacterium]|nr:amidohydrolase [Bacteroidota bacterium]